MQLPLLNVNIRSTCALFVNLTL